MGNTEQDLIGSGGLAFYYLRSVDEMSEMISVFGYSNKFDGAAVVLNAMVKQRDPEKENTVFRTAVQGFTNDGSHNLNMMRHATSQCYASIRNGDKVRLQVQYQSTPDPELNV